MVDLDRTPKAKRKIPPLVWIILAVIAGWIAYSFIARGGERTTPQGGTMPQPPASTSYMPEAPASGDAPGTPGGAVVTPTPGPPAPAPSTN